MICAVDRDHKKMRTTFLEQFGNFLFVSNLQAMAEIEREPNVGAIYFLHDAQSILHPLQPSPGMRIKRHLQSGRFRQRCNLPDDCNGALVAFRR